MSHQSDWDTMVNEAAGDSAAEDDTLIAPKSAKVKVAKKIEKIEKIDKKPGRIH